MTQFNSYEWLLNMETLQLPSHDPRIITEHSFHYVSCPAHEEKSELIRQYYFGTKGGKVGCNEP